MLTTVATFLLILLLLLQTSFFQNYLADYALDLINQKTKHTAKVTNINIKWFDFIEIKDLELRDYNNNIMLKAREFEVDYQLNQLITEGNLYFDKVSLDDGALNLKKYNDTLDINLIEFVNSLNKISNKPEKGPKASPKITVNAIRLDNFSFSYDNHLKDSLSDGLFDYGHFRLDIPVASFREFHAKADTITANVIAFTGKDHASGLNLVRLKTIFSINNSALVLQNLILETPHSIVRDFIQFNYSEISDLGSFVDSVSFNLNLIGSRIARTDLAFFASMPDKDFVLDISSKISGSVPKLSLDNLQLAIGERTHLYGNIEMYGLPLIEETFVDARVDEGELYPDDVKDFVGDAYENIEKLGDILFSGQFLGFTHDFVANAEFITDQGNLNSDLNLKIPKVLDNTSYSGKLKLEDFNLGKVIQQPDKVGEINFDGEVEGSGLNQKNAKFFMNARLTDSEFFKYSYEEILAEGDFASEFFKGKLIINDENCDLKLEGDVNLGVTPELVNIQSDVSNINFKALGFSSKEISASSKIVADITGISIDSLQGNIKLTEAQVYWGGDSLSMDSLSVTSFNNNSSRNITISVPDVEINMEGDFLFSTLIKDVGVITKELKEYFSADVDDRKSLVSNDMEFDKYSIDFSIKYDNINPYLQLLTDDFYISENGEVAGTYYQRRNATLVFYAEIDSINYDGIGYNENSIDVNLSKDLDSLGIIASAYLSSKEQVWRSIQPTENLSLEGVWFNNSINFNFNIEQPENNSSASINAEMKLLNDRILFNFQPSRVFALGEQWYFNPFNKLNITSGNIIFDRIELYHNEQSISLTGKYSDSLDTDLKLEVKDFDLSILNTISPSKLGGVLNTNVELDRRDNKDPFKLLGQIDVNHFEINDFVVGNLKGKTNWNPELNGLSIGLDVSRESVNTVSVNGHYFPNDSINQLDVLAEFNGAALAIAGPLFTGIFSNLNGMAEGRIEVRGSPDHPILNGETQINNGMLTFDYLGTTYDFNGELEFDNTAINFNGIRLTDKEGDRASLNGEIQHNGFKDFKSDLSLAASNFAFLNTSSINNNLYYGTANATGDIEVTGPFEDLYIKANVTTEKGTKIFIPLSGESDISQKDYISFVDFSDSTSHVDLEEIVRQSVTGVRLNFEIDVTPDAYVELIFDIKTGDIIRGRGNGNINLSLDTNGDFELFGDLTIVEGAYNFTIPNFINKEFKVVPGSTISWYGDPYKGILDLEASYRQLASLEDYQDQPSSTVSDGVSPKYPFLVVLELKGEMLSPSIDFSIELDESQASLASDQQFIVQSINNDEQELKRQVFSLLILRKFLPPASYKVGPGDVNSSVSEFLSNQFSYFISQVDENLEVDVDLSSMSQDAFNTFQLRFSYTFLDGRLRVSGGGAVPQNTADDASATSFIGDWSVRYLLTPDGHLRVKAFSQSEQIAGSQQRETGVSFQYVKSFDDFKDLVNKARESSIKSKPKDISKEREANSTSED